MKTAAFSSLEAKKNGLMIDWISHRNLKQSTHRTLLCRCTKLHIPTQTPQRTFINTRTLAGLFPVGQGLDVEGPNAVITLFTVTFIVCCFWCFQIDFCLHCNPLSQKVSWVVKVTGWFLANLASSWSLIKETYRYIFISSFILVTMSNAKWNLRAH